MTLTPPSSIAPSSVTILGTVAVTQSTSPWVVQDTAAESSLASASGALNDVALTAILQRDRMATE